MTDLPTTLRQYIQPEMLGRAASPFEQAVLEAADEIERLRKALREIQELPLSAMASNEVNRIVREALRHE